MDFHCTVGGFIADSAGDALKNMAKAIGEATDNVLKTLGTFWVKVGTPDLTAVPGGSTASDPVAFIQNSLWFWTLALAVFSVLVGAGKMMIERRGAPLRELTRSLVTLIVVTGAGVAAIGILVVAADQFSVWIIDRSTQGRSFGQNLRTMLNLSGSSAMGSIMIILLGFIAILSSCVQIVLMIIRGGLLVVLTGVFPTAAAFTNTKSGKAWFGKCVAWLIAFILYKPAAAVIYATAFRLTTTNVFNTAGTGDAFDASFLSAVIGLGLMIMALFAMPALMRFVTPMVNAAASGSGTMASGAAAGLATGAISLGGSGRGGGTSSGTGSPSTPNGSPSNSAGPSGTKAAGDAGSSRPGPAAGGEASAGAAGAGGGAAARGTAAASGTAAAAAGPVGVAVLAAHQGAAAARSTAGAVQDMSEESTGGP
ncbi:hypothetical protein IV498_14685 [Paenarthrobacter sp. Z7-10]|nr:hypothetical protein [Paenarthrobacter sp. Z7-10]